MSEVRRAEEVNRAKGRYYKSMSCPLCGAGCIVCGGHRRLWFDSRKDTEQSAKASVLNGNYSKTWNAPDLVQRLLMVTDA